MIYPRLFYTNIHNTQRLHVSTLYLFLVRPFICACVTHSIRPAD